MSKNATKNVTTKPVSNIKKATTSTNSSGVKEVTKRPVAKTTQPAKVEAVVSGFTPEEIKILVNERNNSPDFFLDLLGEYDPANIVLSPVYQKTSIIGKTKKSEGQKVTVFCNNGHYLVDDVKHNLLFRPAPTVIYGFNLEHNLDVPKELRTVQNAKGAYFTYYMTSKDTKDEPTEEEQWTMDLLDNLNQALKDAYASEMKVPKTTRLPAPSKNAYLGAKDEETREVDWSQVVKPGYNYPCKFPITNPPELNQEGLKRTKLKVLAFGSQKGLKVDAACFNEDGQPLDILDHLAVQKDDDDDKNDSKEEKQYEIGNLDCVVRWYGGFFGTHGSLPFGASNQLKVVQLSYEKRQKNSANVKMYLNLKSKVPNAMVQDNGEDPLQQIRDRLAKKTQQAPLSPKDTNDDDIVIEDDENLNVADDVVDEVEEPPKPAPKKKVVKKIVKKVVKKKVPVNNDNVDEDELESQD